MVYRSLPPSLSPFAPWVLEEEEGGKRSAGISTEVEKTAKKKICGAATDLWLMLQYTASPVMTAISLSGKKGGKETGCENSNLSLLCHMCPKSSSRHFLLPYSISVLFFSSSGGGRWKPGGDASYGQRNGRHFIKMYFGPSHAAGRSVIEEKRARRDGVQRFLKMVGEVLEETPSATDGPKKGEKTIFLPFHFEKAFRYVYIPPEFREALFLEDNPYFCQPCYSNRGDMSTLFW